MRGDRVNHDGTRTCSCKACQQERALLPPAAALPIVDRYCARLAEQGLSAELAAGLRRLRVLRQQVTR